jgi:sulfur carrier protein
MGRSPGDAGHAWRYRALIDLHVNGEPRRVAARDVRTLLMELGLDPEGRGVAVAVDAAVVPRAEWSEHLLESGQRVEIVGAAQGG